ncbi:MAG: hypothetical protein ACOC38_07540, partial [Promethearchaeia archaeon]
FNVSEYEAGEYLELSKNVNYPFLPQTNTSTVTPTSDLFELFAPFAIGVTALVIVLVIGYKIFQQ